MIRAGIGTTLAESLSGLQVAHADYQNLKDSILRAYVVTASRSRIKLHQLHYDHQELSVSILGKCRPFCPVVATPTVTKWGYADYFRNWNEHSHCELTMDFALDNLSGDFKQHVFLQIRNPRTVEEMHDRLCWGIPTLALRKHTR